jgi:hypothetical protein
MDHLHGRTIALASICTLLAACAVADDLPYPIVDTGQDACYDAQGQIAPPAEGQPFYGQDAQYAGRAPQYRDNGDGTVSDLVTGLCWQQDPGPKVAFDQAVAGAAGFRLAGYTDWRLPSIKELYSLIDFRGTGAFDAGNARPYIDTSAFVFHWGDPAAGERPIDSQYVSATQYVSTTMGGNPTVFGVNFADGRIKGYPQRKGFYCLYVRGNPAYGQNAFVDSGDGTITDGATGLTWMRDDSGIIGAGPYGSGRLTWQQALEWAEGLVYAGQSDWRLPNAKELQSIVDYTRSPATSDSPASDPVFRCSVLTGGNGWRDWGYYWSSTTHLDGPRPGGAACYVAFGRAWGHMGNGWVDVHGAGAQRSDPKEGDPAWFPQGRGPQGDEIRIGNLVRCVRGGA